MAKFNVGDKVVRNIGWLEYCFWEHGSNVLEVVAVLDRGQTLRLEGVRGEWDADKFDLYDESPKEAANGIAPLSLIQYNLPLIIQWGRDRGILDNSTPLGQSRKTAEEVRELIEAAAILHACDTINQGPYEKDEDYRKATLDSLADAIGDIFVTLVMVAGCAKLDINACVAGAYNTIKDRKGYLRPDGVFVKEEQV